MRLIRRAVTVAAVVCLSPLLAGASSARTAARDEERAAVSYCELMRNVEKYDGKRIRVFAVYRYGFEWSELYCPACLNKARIWVDLDESFVSSTKPSVRKRIGEHGFKGRTVKVVMVGRFDAGGGYGHLGAYRFRLLVSRLEKADVILNDSPSPNALPQKVLSEMHCSEN